MEKLLKVNSSHAACVQAPNGIMVMGNFFSSTFYFFAHVFNGVKYFFFKSDIALTQERNLKSALKFSKRSEHHNIKAFLNRLRLK